MESSSPDKAHWWQWPTTLSLDAPAVAVVWQWLFAQTTGATLAWFHHVILAAAVWLAYSADRWIEGWRLPPEHVQTQRHQFYQRHRWTTFGVWLALLISSIALSFNTLNATELKAGLLLLGPVLAYLLSHQLLHRKHPLRVPKELCVALLFAAGIAVFSFAQITIDFHHGGILLILFGLLCFADCALISVWEDEVDRQHGQTSLALQYPGGHWLVHFLPWIIAVVSLGFVINASAAPRIALLCISCSALLLGLIDQRQDHHGREWARAWADFALLTPLIPWLICR